MIVPLLRKIDDDVEGKKKEHEENVNKSSIKIYLAADDTKDVLKIVGHHKVGNIKAQMEDFEPAPPPAPPVEPAPVPQEPQPETGVS